MKPEHKRFHISKVTFHCYTELVWSKMLFGITLMTNEGVLAVQVGKLIVGVYW